MNKIFLKQMALTLKKQRLVKDSLTNPSVTTILLSTEACSVKFQVKLTSTRAF